MMEHTIEQKRKEPRKISSLELPKLTLKRPKQPILQFPKRDPLNNLHEQSVQIVAKLDDWATSLPTIRKKRNIMSESIFYLYKSVSRYGSTNSQLTSLQENLQAQISSSNLFLSQLEIELSKIKRIKYFSIYQNVQYCAGVYQIAFNQIFKKINAIQTMLENSLKRKKKQILKIRQSQLKEVTIRDENISRIIKNNQSDEIKQIEDKTQVKNECQEQKDQQYGQLTKSINIRETKSRIDKFSQIQQPSNKLTRSQFLIQNLQQTKQLIESEQKKLREIWRMLDRVEQARARTLSFSLSLGYDIRDEGLLWILKKINNSSIQKKQKNKVVVQDFIQTNLQNNKNITINKQNYIPNISQFPSFLTHQQIHFIIKKFKNDFKLYQIQIEKQSKQQQEKQVMQAALTNVMRNCNRKLSMIRQQQLRSKLLKQRQTEKVSEHRYLNQNTLKLIQNSFKIKSTKNQLVYQQTTRKLNKFCMQEIHGKGKNQSNKNIRSNTNIAVNKLMGEVRQMLSNNQYLREKEDKIKTDEQRQLSDIIKKLRDQIYEQRNNSQRRNPISVMCCLVGWRKAKKILQNEMNISMSLQG